MGLLRICQTLFLLRGCMCACVSVLVVVGVRVGRQYAIELCRSKFSEELEHYLRQDTGRRQRKISSKIWIAREAAMNNVELDRFVGNVNMMHFPIGTSANPLHRWQIRYMSSCVCVSILVIGADFVNITERTNDWGGAYDCSIYPHWRCTIECSIYRLAEYFLHPSRRFSINERQTAHALSTFGKV